MKAKGLNVTQALEPHISEQIMKLHHTRHHQAYVNGVNAAEKAYTESTDVREKIALQSALKFNGGGASFSPSPSPCVIFALGFDWMHVGY